MHNINNQLSKNQFTVENTPILFQEEYYNISWGLRHSGSFLHPEFGLLKYPIKPNTIPLGWNFCNPSSVDKYDYESIANLYGYISPEDLFYNLSLCNFYFDKESNKEPNLRTIDLRERVENIIDTCEKRFEFNYGLCDGGYKAFNVYIYREKRNVYERFTLAHSENMIVNHSSIEVEEVLKLVGFYPIF